MRTMARLAQAPVAALAALGKSGSPVNMDDRRYKLMRRSISISIALLTLIWATPAGAANSVVVESKEVALGATGVTVGIYITNEDSIPALVIPLQIRSVTPGAFIADTLALETQNRLASYLTDMVVNEFLTGPDSSYWYMCDGNGFQTRGDPDFISPNAMIFVGLTTSYTRFPIGDDGSPPGGTPSLKLTFNVTEVAGTFEIDTACITPNNHLAWVSYPGNGRVYPSFTKGVITIGCACDCHADPVCDNVHDVLDLVTIIDVAYRGGDPVPDPNPQCPYVTTDVNCDDVTNVFDVGLMNLVVNYAADPDSTFCNPCP